MNVIESIIKTIMHEKIESYFVQNLTIEIKYGTSYGFHVDDPIEIAGAKIWCQMLNIGSRKAVHNWMKIKSKCLI